MKPHTSNEKAAGVSGGIEQPKAVGLYPRGGAWQRVSKKLPCPICGRRDWCSISADGAVAVCMRVADGAIKQTKHGGFLHRLRDDGDRDSVRTNVRTIVIPFGTRHRPDLTILTRKFQTSVNPDRLCRLADRLGVSVASLQRLSIGWGYDRFAWSFPMTDADGNILGIRLRREDGSKSAVTGGKEGLFVPAGLTLGGELIITEGPTDCAALLDLGFAAVGRPSCTGGTTLLIALVKKLMPSRVVIVADGDEPGQRGANELAPQLSAFCRDVRIVTPPDGMKDARAWKCAGATADDFRNAAARQTPYSLKVVATLAGKAVRDGR